MDPTIVFGILAGDGAVEGELRLLAASIRAFAGRLASASIRLLVAGPAPDLSEHLRNDLASLRANFVSFGSDPDVRRFPLASEALAEAAAEAVAFGHAELLIWMDHDSIVLQEPTDLRLEPRHTVGCRPVDHTLIGSPCDASIDGFWRLIYNRSGVPAERLSPMVTTVNRVRIRPYFNASLIVVRPEESLYRRWSDTLVQLIRDAGLQESIETPRLHGVFVHQAAPTGTILAHAGVEALRLLPPGYAYPLHMHDTHPADDGPAALSDLVTCRYDTLFEDLPGARQSKSGPRSTPGSTATCITDPGGGAYRRPTESRMARPNKG